MIRTHNSMGDARQLKRLGFILLTIAAIVAAGLWTFVARKREQDTLMFQLNEASRAIAAYLVQSGGSWPLSLTDLEAAGVARIISSQEFVATVDGSPGKIPDYGGTGVTIDLRQIAIGWGGVPVDDSGLLVAVRQAPMLNERAAFLSARLRELSGSTTSQPAPQPSP